MDSVRYYLALLVLITWIPAIFWWYVIHPVIGFWRKLGVTLTYLILISILVVMGYGLFLIRAPLLSVEFGTNYSLIGLGVLAYLAASMVQLRASKQLSFRTLVGVPELNNETDDGTLLKEGIYSRIRHPRYVSVTLGLLGVAWFANYLILYALLTLTLPGIYLIVLLEERELLARFGEEYESYCQRVPRFIPKLGSSKA